MEIGDKLWQKILCSFKRARNLGMNFPVGPAKSSVADLRSNNFFSGHRINDPFLSLDFISISIASSVDHLRLI